MRDETGPGDVSRGRVVVVVPTYCEAEMLPGLVEAVLGRPERVDLLIVDDNSPDGTGRIADGLAAADARISVMHREGKQGLGPAYVAGFRRAIADGYEVVMEMDADGSHRADELGRLIAAVDAGADLAIGTRWMPGGRTVNWPWYRRAVSRCGTAYARMLLGSRLRDITSGFRAIRSSLLESIDLDSLQSAGYAFQIEVAWRAEAAGAVVAEVPITFVERESGASKMTAGIAIEALAQVTRWGMARRRPTGTEPLRSPTR